MKIILSIVLFIVCAIHAGAQRFSTNSVPDNSILLSNNISKELLTGLGADEFFPKEAFSATSKIKYITAIVNNIDTCPNKDNLEDLCDSIFDQERDEDTNGPYLYTYQRIILEASCVNEGDSKAEKIRKVNEMWDRNHDKLYCYGSSVFRDGNILKLAVARRFDSVIEDAAQVWKVNLNIVDNDWKKETVLDFLQHEINVFKNTRNGPELQGYYKVLRAAGAKHASELKK